jgi:methylmalonyl-CoA mutase N-terminal domain/subunit
MEAKQAKKLKKFRKDRDGKKATAALDRLRSAASSQENLMPFIVAAVKADATLGEVSDALRKVFGTHREILTI